jgi:hypothetical protein
MLIEANFTLTNDLNSLYTREIKLQGINGTGI